MCFHKDELPSAGGGSWRETKKVYSEIIFASQPFSLRSLAKILGQCFHSLVDEHDQKQNNKGRIGWALLILYDVTSTFKSETENKLTLS